MTAAEMARSGHLSNGLVDSADGYAQIGSLEVTVVGLGTNNFGYYMEAAEVPAVVDAALDHGINFFDTADMYRDSEVRLGAALGRRRDDVVIATKFGNMRKPEGGWRFCARPEYVRERVDASLARLDTECIDLFQLHGPDPDTPIAETLGALAEAVAAGKVREIGCSNFSAAQLVEADAAAGDGPRFVSVQNMFNMLTRGDETEVLPTCQRLGIAYLPYWPLANGILTGKYERGRPPAEGTRMHRMGDKGAALLGDTTFDVLDRLTAWAAARGRSLLDLAFAWLAAKPAVASVIAGATRPEQVAANAGTATWSLTPDELSELDGLLDPSGGVLVLRTPTDSWLQGGRRVRDEDRYLIVSADSHAGPSLERDLRPYCPEPHRDAFDAYGAAYRDAISQRPDPMVQDATEPALKAYEDLLHCEGLHDPHAFLRDMDAEGIAAQVIFAGGGNKEPLPWSDGFNAGDPRTDPALRALGGHIWNQWLAEFVSVAPGATARCDADPDLGRAGRHRRDPVGQGARAARHQLPGAPSRLPRLQRRCLRALLVSGRGDRSTARLPRGERHAAGSRGRGALLIFATELQFYSRRAFGQMAFGGVFDRHPRLRVGFVEQRAGWIPEHLRELDSCYLDPRRDYSDKPARLPSEYWRDNCFVGCSFMAHFEAELRHEMGLGTVLWGADYPHVEGTWQRTELALRKTFAGIPVDDVRAILGDNAVRIFQLDTECAPAGRRPHRLLPRPDRSAADGRGAPRPPWARVPGVRSVRLTDRRQRKAGMTFSAKWASASWSNGARCVRMIHCTPASAYACTRSPTASRSSASKR